MFFTERGLGWRGRCRMSPNFVPWPWIHTWQWCWRLVCCMLPWPHPKRLQILELVQTGSRGRWPHVAMAKTYQNMVSFVQGVGHPKKNQELSDWTTNRTNQGSTSGQPPSHSRWKVKAGTGTWKVDGFPGHSMEQCSPTLGFGLDFGVPSFDKFWIVFETSPDCSEYKDCLSVAKTCIYCSIWVLTRPCRAELKAVCESHYEEFCNWRWLKMISLLRY